MKKIIIEYAPSQGKDPGKELMAAVMDILAENNTVCSNISISTVEKKTQRQLQIPSFMLPEGRQQA